MREVFVSYKRQDKARVLVLVERLRKAGLTVWLDVEIPTGASWRQNITKKLEAAGCVIVVWSAASVEAPGEFVQDEASRAKKRGVLLPVRIDNVSPPVGFGEIQTLDLVGWKGSRRDPRFRDLVAAAKAMLAGSPRPKPMAPGRRKRIAAALGTGIPLIAGVIGFMGDVAGLQGLFCKLPGVHAACGAMGWGGVPTRAEEELWRSRPKGDCDTLREYLARFPNGAYVDQAHSLLQAAAYETRETWTPEKRRLPLAVRRGFKPMESEETAKEDALSRGAQGAQRVCEGFNQGEHRLLSARAEARTWNCEPADTGKVCGFDGYALCQVEVRQLDRFELCP